MAGKTLSASYVLDASGVQKGVQDADKHLSGLTTSFSKIQGLGSGAFGALSHAIAESGIAAGPLGAMFSGLSNAVQELGGRFDELAEHGSRVQKVGAVLAGVGGGVAALGAGLDELATPLEQSQKQLETAISDTGRSFDTYRGQIDATDTRMQNLGHRNQETNQALATLTEGLHDPALALKYLGETADIAAARHISLTDAADKVVKVYGGSTRILREFGLQATSSASSVKALEVATKNHQAALDGLQKAQQSLQLLEDADHGKKKLSLVDEDHLRLAHEAVTAAQKKLNDSTAAMQAAQASAKTQGEGFAATMGVLADRVHGQAQASVDTFGGRLDILKDKLLDHVATIGQKYGPAMMGMGAAVSVTGGIVDVAGGILSRFSRAAEAGTAATEGLTAATEGMAAAEGAAAVTEGLALAPIAAIVVGIAALGVAAYEIATHWHEVWDGIKAVAVDAWHFLDDILHNKVVQIILAPVAPLLVLAMHWHTVWDDMKSAGQDAWKLIEAGMRHIADVFLDVAGGIVHGAASAFGWIPGIGGKLKDAASAFDRFHAEVDQSLGGVNASLKNSESAMNNFNAQAISVGSSIRQVSAGATGALAQFSSLGGGPTHRAGGGPIDPTDVYFVGEHGPELFVSSRAGQIIDNASLRAAASGAGRPVGTAAATGPAVTGITAPVVVNVNVSVAGSVLADRDLGDKLTTLMRSPRVSDAMGQALVGRLQRLGVRSPQS